LLAITALLRWPEDVRRVRERKRSTLPSGPRYQTSEHTADRAPHRRKPIRKDELTKSGSMSNGRACVTQTTISIAGDDLEHNHLHRST
jgi:hypothetical protein